MDEPDGAPCPCALGVVEKVRETVFILLAATDDQNANTKHGNTVSTGINL